MTDKQPRKLGPREAGRKGGQATSQRYGPGFYSEIGTKGGQAISRNRQHMSAIGRRGGQARKGRPSSS